jgi:phosphatidylserine decarboxylase
MRKPSFSIAPEGAIFIILSAVSAITFGGLRWWFLALIFFALTWFCAWFFRDPERFTPQDDNIAVSPADGRVIGIQSRKSPFDDEYMTCISIFMNVFKVHVNRFPVDGKLCDIKYIPGKVINAEFDKASDENERCAYLLEDTDGERWGMVQIAGLIARRIVCRAQIKDIAIRGERFGLIRFGSRVDVYLPATYDANVHVGNKVVAGESIIARKRIEA